MPVPFLIAGMLVSGLEPPVTPSTPIVVTAHPWAPFISPMGEPFRAHKASDDTLAIWFYGADRNRDGFLTADEMLADADRFFAKLDANHDGEIDPDEIANYEWEVAPEIQAMSGTRRAPGQPVPAVKPSDGDQGDGDRRRERRAEIAGSLGLEGALQGAARYGLLNMPEPVAAADTDFNREISRDEFRAAALARFQLLDTARDGKLMLVQLELLPHVPGMKALRSKRKSAPDARIGNPLPPGP